MKSMKIVSLHLRAIAKFLEPGFRLRPFVLVMQRGFPLESVQEKCVFVCLVSVRNMDLPKKSLFLVAVDMISSGGGPSTSMRQASCSTSFSPGKSG